MKITIDRSLVEQALEALEAYATHRGLPGPCPVRDVEYALRAALEEPQEPVAWQVSADFIKWRGVPNHTTHSQPPEELVQEPYTDDVTRIMRDAGMTFHLGLPHKAVVEQMTRVVDLVYAEASIKAAQQFATPPQTAEPVQQALAEADRIMGHEDEATEWRERWEHLFSCALTNGGYQCSCGANQRALIKGMPNEQTS